MNTAYSNTIGVPQSLDGAKSYVVDEAHFTQQECNITADDKLTVCCPVNFKKGFVFDGDICDLDGSATFNSFAATDGYFVENAASTCDTPVARTNALNKLKRRSVHRLMDRKIH